MFIRKSKAYVGHVGDSGLLIGYSKNQAGSNKNNLWQARKLTRVRIKKTCKLNRLI